MILVLADDFSGAAEIGGVAHAFGLPCEVKLNPDFSTNAEVLVIDLDSRSLSREGAVKKWQLLAKQLAQSERRYSLFKKVDSVMRGYLIPEISALHEQLLFDRIFLFPANPGKERRIINGTYLIGETPLDQTVFGSDPDFPVTTALITRLIGNNFLPLNHIHLSANTPVPETGFITGDLTGRADFGHYLSSLGENDLCCGAAECFSAFLERLGYFRKETIDNPASTRTYTVILSGTTVSNVSEAELLQNRQVPMLSLPGTWQGGNFELDESEEHRWHQHALEILENRKSILVNIQHPLIVQKNIGETFSYQFVRLMDFLFQQIDRRDVHLCITGGSTASFVMRRRVKGTLTVHRNVAPGVVTLLEDGGGLFTVKPGSYPWTEGFLLEVAG